MRMAGVFDINVDKLDLNKIRICGQTGHTSDAHFSREARTKTDLLQCVRKNTLIAFVQQCRMHNVDALHPCSLQLTILLMSKCTDRKQLCARFLSFVSPTHQSVEIEDSATTAIDSTESHALQSTSDWVALFDYIEVVHLSESLRRALHENPRVDIFVKATRHIFPPNAEIETFVRPMLCTLLMYIPAANMLERVLLAQGPQPRDIEVMCLRGVNAYVDQCQHMSNENTIDAISLLMQAIRVNPSFQTDVAGVVDASTDDKESRPDLAKRQFSLRRHIRDMQGAAVLHHASDLMLHPHSQQSVTEGSGTSRVAPAVSLDFSRHQRQENTRPAGVCAPAPEHLLQRPVPHPQTSSGFGSKQTWHRSSRSRKRANGDSRGAAVNRRLSARLGRGMSPCDAKASLRGSSSFSGSSV